ncbi:MAG TPA: SpoIIE family protein phosphatase, partial [Ktedonobacteraceae bacterium]|nr:SpoIIE family protein phosphatase [Ktedonobacteraceae bacterium]
SKNAPLSNEEYAQLLVEGIQSANQAVHQRNIEQRGDMGTTVTGALVVDNVAYVVNVGDSRTYLYRDSDGLKKITNDHSVVASLVEAGIIKPDDIYTHPKRSHIYRSLGEKPNVEVDHFTVELQEGDKLLLCSDGLWDMVRDPKIENVIKSPDSNPAATSDALIQAAFDGGGEDNVSVIVIQIAEPPAKVTSMPRIDVLAKPDTVQMPQI